MVTTIGAFIVFAICLAGCGMHAYYVGRRVGIESAVDYMAENGHIDLEDE